MRGDIFKSIVKAVNNGVDPTEFIIQFFKENADYSMDERDLKRSLQNALSLVDFVKKNSIRPGEVVEFNFMGERRYVAFDGGFSDGRRIIIENSIDYDKKRAFARPGDVVMRINEDFTVEVVEVIE